MNEVGGRACAGQNSAFSRLLIEVQGDDIRAGQAALNLAHLIRPDEPCADAGYRHDFDKWLGYLEHAQQTGNPIAQAYFGQMLLEGRNGVQKDRNRGLILLNAAFSKGSSSAALVLAKNYLSGEHVRRNVDLAERIARGGLTFNPTDRQRRTLERVLADIAAGN
ncbi:hypothetical protein [Shimia ponticola]|uniref:hypothetical protein n=1 Tax=Shimia ponticola TaxID=2582893 RepID=UPI0011BD78B0|nr:hypothetical protein [Shimia ponticola]